MGAGCGELHRVGLLTNGCTHRRRAHRTRKGRGDFCRLTAHEFFHRDLPVTVHIGRGVEAGGLFQVGAGGLCQFFDGQASRLVLVGGEEAALRPSPVQAQVRAPVRGPAQVPSWNQNSGEGIGGRLVLPSVVRSAITGSGTGAASLGALGRGTAEGPCWKRNGVLRSRGG